jgi:hypothetical protein
MAINQTVDCGMSAFSVRCEIESVPALGVSIGSDRRRRSSSSAASGYLPQANVRQLPSPYNFFHVSKPASSTANDDDEEDGEKICTRDRSGIERVLDSARVHFCHGFDSNH